MPRSSHDDDDDSNDDSTSSDGISEDATTNPTLTYYPAYCNKASPTWFTWVKLTAHNIHHDLHEQPRNSRNNVQQEILPPRTSQAHAQNKLLYCLNHPIQFVQIVGVVISIEEFIEWFWVFTVDDSSGATIDVHCRKPPREEKQVNNLKADSTATDPTPEEKEERKAQEFRVGIVSRLEIGDVVQVKGTIGTFRGTRKIQLERITTVPDTMAEMKLITARTKTLKEVLSKPWVVTPVEQERLLKEAQGELDEEDARLKRRRKRQALEEEREKRQAQKILKQYEADEIKRKQMAEVAREAGGRLQKKPKAKSK